MVAVRNDGIDVSLKATLSGLSTTNGHLTIYAVNNASNHPSLSQTQSPYQIWAIDPSGGRHELTNTYLESVTSQISATLDSLGNLGNLGNIDNLLSNYTPLSTTASISAYLLNVGGVGGK